MVILLSENYYCDCIDNVIMFKNCFCYTEEAIFSHYWKNMLTVYDDKKILHMKPLDYLKGSKKANSLGGAFVGAW